MAEKLIDAIQSIRSNRTLGYVDEASIKAGVVLRVLSCLGWNPFDIDEVKPEHTIGTKRVDYALRMGGMSKVFLEVKRISEKLEAHQEQLLGYSFQEGVKLAVLTNGGTWWFYLPLNEGSWERRRFYSVDIFEQDPEDVASRFEEFLSKEYIRSGDAIKNAEEMYRGQQKKHVLREAIPRAWHKIVSDPDDLFIDLIIETTEKLSGFRPEIDDVEKFLTENLKDYRVPFASAPKTAVLTPSPFSSSAQITDDYINKKPQQFIFLGKKYEPKSWQDILMTVANELYSRHGSEFDKCLILRGSKMAYFSTNPNELSYPKQIASSSYYAEVHLSSNSIVKRCRDLMALFGYSEDKLRIVAA